MGSNSSSQSTTINMAVSAAMSIINNSTTNCQQNATSSQKIKVTTGNNSIVSITNNTLTATQSTQLACLATTTFTQSQISDMNSKFNAAVSSIAEGIPTLNATTSNNNNIVENIKQTVTDTNMFNTIINSAQSMLTGQSIVAKAGDGSTIVVDGNSISAGITAINNIVTNTIQNVYNSATNTTDNTSTATNANTPITALGNAGSKIIGAAGTAGAQVIGAASTITGQMSSTYMVMIVGVVIVIVAFLYMLTSHKPTLHHDGATGQNQQLSSQPSYQPT